MKQVEVSILGQVYMLGCPEGAEPLLAEAVTAVDREMTAIRDGGKVRARERIAVLAALNLGYQLAERNRSATKAEAAAASPSATHPAWEPDDEARLVGLLQRLDAVLSQDGRLL